MSTIEKITRQVQKLPEPWQLEVLDFVEFLLSKRRGSGKNHEDIEWIEFSLRSPVYDESDIKKSGSEEGSGKKLL